jgi:hypothetical protein
VCEGTKAFTPLIKEERGEGYHDGNSKGLRGLWFQYEP